MLSLNGLPVGLLALVVLFARQGVTVEAEFRYFSCQPKRYALVYI